MSSFHSTCHHRQQTMVSSGVTLKVSKGGELQAHIACHATNINSGLSALIMYAIFIAHDLSLRNSMVVVALRGSVVRRMPLHNDAHSYVSAPGASRPTPRLWCVAAGWLRLVQACRGSCFSSPPTNRCGQRCVIYNFLSRFYFVDSSIKEQKDSNKGSTDAAAHYTRQAEICSDAPSCILFCEAN